MLKNYYERLTKEERSKRKILRIKKRIDVYEQLSIRGEMSERQYKYFKHDLMLLERMLYASNSNEEK